jgi:hypothetical protein
MDKTVTNAGGKLVNCQVAKLVLAATRTPSNESHPYELGTNRSRSIRHPREHQRLIDHADLLD